MQPAASDEDSDDWQTIWSGGFPLSTREQMPTDQIIREEIATIDIPEKHFISGRCAI